MQEVTVPPERVEDEFDQWHDSYSVESLDEMSASGVRSAGLQFLNEVQRLKTTYKRGRLVTPEMAQIVAPNRSLAHNCETFVSAFGTRLTGFSFKKARGRIERRAAG